MTPRFRSILAVALLCAASAAAWSQPVVTSLNQDTLPRSGRLSIVGSGFGADGQVLVGGVPAWVSTWTPNRIVAYVPEASPEGTHAVVVEAGGQASDPWPLAVTTRRAEGRLRWSFEIDSDVVYHRPALAPDGTLYVHGHSAEGGGEGRVFAISPTGALLWIQKDVVWTAYVPPVAGPDGAVYVGSIDNLYRISPTGEIDWVFAGNTIRSSAAIGPDGTIYAGFEHAPEAVALDPADGSLIWSNSPGLGAWGTGGNEARLGRSSAQGPVDRLYLWWDALAAFTLEGDHLFTTTAGNIDDHEVAVGADGTLYAPGDFESDLVALDPFDGGVLWSANDPWLAGTSDVEIGPDDTLYFVSDGRWIDAFDPVSRTSIWHRDVFHWLRRPSLTPDGGTLLAAGGGFCAAEQGCVVSFIKAFETAGGQELWHLELNEAWDPDFRNITWDHARISPDSRMAYFTGWVAGSHDAGDERSLLWAVGLEDAEVFADGFESGDLSAWDVAISQ